MQLGIVSFKKIPKQETMINNLANNAQTKSKNNKYVYDMALKVAKDYSNSLD